MSKTSLLSAFQVEQKKNTPIAHLTDYEVFKDKDLLDDLRRKIIENLVDKDIPKEKSVSDFINEEIDNTTIGCDLGNLERSHLYTLINNEINGYGPLTELLEDSHITEIMVNAPDNIYIEIDGILSKDESVSFINNDHILRTMQKLLRSSGKSIDTSHPMIDARLKDGSRINAIIPPLSSGPVMTIHKFMDSMNSIEDFIRIGSCTPYMARFLEACVLAKLNIIISGTTSSGKTTLLNVLSTFIEDSARIVTIEDARELKLHQTNVVSLETRPSVLHDKEDVTIRDLVINSLRMRPDRILVGEVRGAEAFDMLQAMNTGHDGSISTMHANNVVDALKRLETMTLMSGVDIPIEAIREYICSAVDIVIHIERLSDGKKKITSICEVVGMENGKINVKEIFAFKQKGMINNTEIDGEYILYKYVPKVYEKIKKRGVTSVDDMFAKFLKNENHKKK